MPNWRPSLTILLCHLIIVRPLSRTDVTMSLLCCQGSASRMAPSSSMSFAATPTTGRHAAPSECPTTCMGVLRFYSWVVLFSLSLLFVLHLLFRDPFVTLTITISLSWDPSHSPYMPFNLYTVPCITTGQGVLFAYLFLVMDDYSFS